jgi:hypothetical protein
MAPGTGTALVDTPTGGSPRLMGRSRIVHMEMMSTGACMLSWMVEGHDRMRAGGTSEMPFQNPFQSPFHAAYHGNSWVVRLGGRYDTYWSGRVDPGD